MLPHTRSREKARPLRPSTSHNPELAIIFTDRCWPDGIFDQVVVDLQFGINEQLRQRTFLGWRNDKKLEEVVLE
jgi:hypothetical protein